MSWIKRNLYFVVGGAVALILMGLAGFYLFSKWQLNNEVMTKLNTDYSTLQQLNSENPHPGSGTVDNVAEAQAQKRALGEFTTKLRKYYQPINPIPFDPEGPNTNVTDRDFSSALSRTVHQLTKAAENTSVTIPPSYSFSFEAQRRRVTFAEGSPVHLAVQLGDVKAICDILIDAKVNSIDNIRRERVGSDDMTGPQTDYTDEKSVTNELAVLAPYEVTFRCFSSELSAVLSGFAASPHGVLVKSLNVEAATATNLYDPSGMAGGPAYGMAAGGPMNTEADAFARRYGGRMGLAAAEAAAAGATVPGSGNIGRGVLGGGNVGAGAAGGRLGVGGGRYGINEGGMAAPRPAYTAPAQYPTTAPRAGGALPTVLDEKQLKVTMQLVIIKLLPETQAK